MFRSVFELFGRSPFGPMQEHMRVAQRCVHLMAPMMQHVVADNWTQVKMVSKEIYHIRRY